jgi:DnaK suppressor protein
MRDTLDLFDMKQRLTTRRNELLSQMKNNKPDDLSLELSNIEAALTRIYSGDYGFCTECDERISLLRIQANPAVKTCLRCRKY